MSLISYRRGQTSIILRVKILDSSVSTGAGKTGLTSSSSGLKISTIADNESSATVYAQGSSNIEAVSVLGTFSAPTSGKCRFSEVSSSNHPGVYEIQIADARFAVSSAKSLLVSLSGVTGMAETDCVIPLIDMDPYDAVRGGMTALPNAAAGANGGVPLSADTSGRVDVLKINGTSQTAQDLGAINVTNLNTLSGHDPGATLGTSTLDAAGVRSAVGLASANLDTQLGDLPTAAENRAEMDSNSTKLANLDALVSSRGTADPGDAMALTAAYDSAKTAAQAGDPMTLADAAITSAKFDAATAFPLASADAGDTALARTGADGDTLETLSDQVDAAKSDTAAILDDTGTNGVVVASGSKSGYALTSAYDFAKGTVAMTESYAAEGAAPTPAQALFILQQMLAGNFAISGTTLTVYKLDGTTPAATFTLDSDATPTSLTRAT